MSETGWTEVAISTQHDRKGFDCGNVELNTYLQRFARQNHTSGGAKCFVAVEPAQPQSVLGYYTLSPGSLEYARTPEIVRRGLGRYEVPVFRLGRLAVARGVQGRGLGGRLLLAAGRRALLVAEHVGGVALLIDAKDERAADWYASHGAMRLLDTPLTLVLPLAMIPKAIAKAES